MHTEGVVNLGPLTGVNYYTSEFTSNLLSISQLCDTRYSVTFEATGVKIMHKDGNLVGMGVRMSNLYYLGADKLCKLKPAGGRSGYCYVGFNQASRNSECLASAHTLIGKVTHKVGQAQCSYRI
jgi:hypothetical protein